MAFTYDQMVARDQAEIPEWQKRVEEWTSIEQMDALILAGMTTEELQQKLEDVCWGIRANFENSADAEAYIEINIVPLFTGYVYKIVNRGKFI